MRFARATAPVLIATLCATQVLGGQPRAARAQAAPAPEELGGLPAAPAPAGDLPPAAPGAGAGGGERGEGAAPAAEEPVHALPLVPTPAPMQGAPQAPRPLGLRAAGWTLFSLGSAATVAGLVLIPLRPDEVPMLTGIVPMLAAGAGFMILGRVIISAAEERRRRVLPP